jgi:tetratricopeptide (TPR) repeat protein
MTFLNLGIMALVATGVWWLTGVDKTAGGESKQTHYVSRLIRCVAILCLVGVCLWLLEERNLGLAAIPLLMILSGALALLLRSSFAEVLTHGFLRLVDPNLHDDRPLDFGKSRRYMDTIAHLIQNGRRTEAIKLCEELKTSGEVNLATLEMTLEFLGVKPERTQLPKPLAEADRLRAQGKFADAEKLLNALLKKDPEDLAAAMMLVRLYAQDLRQPGRAHEILRRLEKQPHVLAAHVEFARRSIEEWSRPKPEPMVPAAPTESIDELLAQGFYGTAIERLEPKTTAQPSDFSAWLKLAEAYGRYAGNLHRADKIVRRMEADPAFSPEQKQLAKTKLEEWRNAENRVN